MAGTLLCSPLQQEMAYCCCGITEKEPLQERILLLGISLLICSCACAWMVVVQSRRTEAHLLLSVPW